LSSIVASASGTDQRAPVTSNISEISVPRDPLIKISASRAALIPQLKDFWAHRELLYFLIWRDLKVRYRQTLMGIAWVVLQPLLMTLVFTVFFSKLGHFRSEGVPYPLFAYAGLLPWTFFSNSVAAGSSSLLSNSYIITKVYFPRLLLPAAIVGVRLIDFLIASAVLVGLMLFYGITISRSMLMLPVLVAELSLLATAMGAWFSVLNIEYRDVSTVLPVLIQLWMFASPIIYPANLIPPGWRFVYSLNPLVGLVEGFRSAVFGLSFAWQALLVSSITTLLLAAYVAYVFNRSQEYLIDKL
jgi:lipopolysaccharide transport system permease protein